MKTSVLLFLFLFLNLQFAFGQNEGEKVLIEEKAFADKSKIDGTKTAFLAYLSNESIIFSDGKPLNGQKYWSSLEFSDQLTWKPYLVEVANSNDFAYTIGTYKYFLRNESVKPAEIGFFTSIWKKEKGRWKVALDIGNPTKNDSLYLLKNKANSSAKIIQTISNQVFTNDITNLKAAILTADYLLSNNLKKSNAKSKSYSKKVQKFTNSTAKYLYTPQASEIAISGDLAYVYGTVSVNDKTGNYLRVWKKESRKAWKVVLEITTM